MSSAPACTRSSYSDFWQLPCSPPQQVLLISPRPPTITITYLSQSATTNNDALLATSRSYIIQSILCVDECPPHYQPIGQVCFPLSPPALQQYLLQSSFRVEWRQVHFRSLIVFTIILSASLSIVLLGISYFAPRILQRAVIILSLLLVIYVSLVCFGMLDCPRPFAEALQAVNIRVRQIWVAAGTLLALILLGWMFCFNGELWWNGLMMDYACKILAQRVSFIWLILEYYGGMGVAWALFAFQHHCFSHSSSLFLSWTFPPSSLSVLQIMNILEYFWNMQFMKDSRKNMFTQFTCHSPPSPPPSIFTNRPNPQY